RRLNSSSMIWRRCVTEISPPLRHNLAQLTCCPPEARECVRRASGLRSSRLVERDCAVLATGATDIPLAVFPLENECVGLPVCEQCAFLVPNLSCSSTALPYIIRLDNLKASFNNEVWHGSGELHEDIGVEGL